MMLSQVAGTSRFWKSESANPWQSYYFTIPTHKFGDSLYALSYMPNSLTQVAWIVMQQTRKILAIALSAK